MPRITKVYTRTGDDGTTALGSGVRLPKDAARIEAYGTVDELNAVVGVCRTADLEPRIATMLSRIQNELFHLGSDLCVPEDGEGVPTVPRIEARHVLALESDIDTLQAELPPLANFVLPGGAVGAAHLHVARTVARRAERRVIRLAATERVGPDAVRYLNRLSDLLFVMSRSENRHRGVADVLWDSHA